MPNVLHHTSPTNDVSWVMYVISVVRGTTTSHRSKPCISIRLREYVGKNQWYS
jgi:hypothetical protein